MTQSLLLTLSSFALAYLLRDLIAPSFPCTLDFLMPETALTFAVMLVGGVLASPMAVWHALRTPAPLALGVDVAVVEVRNVSQTFGQGELAVQALKPTRLSVDAGELVTLLGPSGSGKRTLLLAISQIHPQTTGRIVIDGQTLYDDGPTSVEARAFRRRKIGFIFQQHSLIPCLTALENVALMPQLSGGGRRESARRTKELQGYLEIAHRGGRGRCQRRCRAAKSSVWPPAARWRTTRR